MLHEALLAAEELADSGELSLRVVAMPWLNRFDADWLAAEVAPFEHVFVLEDHAPVGGLGDGLRAALPGRVVTVFGVEGWPACGTPDEALRFHGLDGASLAARIAAPPVAAPREPARPPLDDQSAPGSSSPICSRSASSSTRGSRPGSTSASAGGSRPSSSCRATRRRNGSTGCPASTCSTGTSSTAGDGLPDRALARVDATLDRQLGYHPLAIRLNHRHGFHAERMQPGHPNWMLDTNRDSRLPHRPRVERAMERWFFSPRRHVPRRLLEAMRRDCSGLVLSNVQPASAVPFLAAARRLGLPVVAHVASWDHTVGKGVISPYCDLYVVQNGVMEDDLAATTGSRRSGFGSRAGRRPTCSTAQAARRVRGAPRALRARPRAPARRSSPGTRRATRRTRGGSSSASSSGGSEDLARAPAAALPAASPRPRSGASGSRAADGSRGRRGAGGELHGPRGPRDAAPARGRRRLQRGHDPPRRARRRPAGRLRPLRRGRAGRASRGRRRTSSASTTRSSPPRAPSTAPSASRRSSPGSSARSRSRTSSPRSGAGPSSRSSARSTAARPSASSTRCRGPRGVSRMRLVMTLLARDEADVVDAQIAFHLHAGVDFVVATDNALERRDDGDPRAVRA